MNSAAEMQRGKQRDYTPLISKVIIALLLILGLVMIGAGVMGIRDFDASGYDAEDAYGAIRDLSAVVDSDWESKLQPLLAEQTPETKAKLDDAAYAMLAELWESQREGSTADLDACLASFAEGERAEKTYQLLYAGYAVNGPRVTSAIRKELALVPAEERADFRRAVLACITDETAPLPANATKAAGELEGAKRAAMLMQVYFVSYDDSGVGIDTELANSFKKAVRNKGAQLDAVMPYL